MCWCCQMYSASPINLCANINLVCDSLKRSLGVIYFFYYYFCFILMCNCTKRYLTVVGISTQHKCWLLLMLLLLLEEDTHSDKKKQNERRKLKTIQEISYSHIWLKICIFAKKEKFITSSFIALGNDFALILNRNPFFKVWYIGYD